MISMIMNRACPLRYRISSWRQLPNCKSNNSRDLHIKVADYFNNTKFRGFRISVEHSEFGTLFACVLDARGDIVTEKDDYGKTELSTETILSELEKYGFFITYNQKFHLGSEQLEYLFTLKNLGYDKLRIVNVDTKSTTDTDLWSPKVVAFQVDPLGDWLNNAYSPSAKEFTEALIAGTAINITGISETKKFRWDWLKDFVANIDDVIAENADEMIYFDEPQPEPDDDYSDMSDSDIDDSYLDEYDDDDDSYEDGVYGD